MVSTLLEKTIPIVRILTGNKNQEKESKGRVEIQRLLDFTVGEQPERPILRKSKMIPSSVPDTQLVALEEEARQTLSPEPEIADIECSLAYGSWRCRCRLCLDADKSK